MSQEYVRFFSRESLYGEKNLLRAELGILGFVKRLRAYKKLRRDELALKLVLKSKIMEVEEQLEILDKMLPHSKMAGLIKEKKRHMDEIKGMTAEDKQAFTLEQEVERIRRKLEMLKDF